jgi:hypothetical protein
MLVSMSSMLALQPFEIPFSNFRGVVMASGKQHTSVIGFRVSDERREILEKAAERAGLRIGSYIIKLFIEWKIFPDKGRKNLKRRPVPSYKALHDMLGVVNKIGGNCKQLSVAMPDTNGLIQTQAYLIRAAAVLTYALHGKKIPDEVNLYELHEAITRDGYGFNQIVKSVNMRKPNLTGLPSTLAAIRASADAIIEAMSGEPLKNADGQAPVDDIIMGEDEGAVEQDRMMELAMEEMRMNMRKAASEHLSPNKDGA